MVIQPFRYDLLPHLQRDQINWLRQIRAHLGGNMGIAFTRWAKKWKLTQSTRREKQIRIRPLSIKRTAKPNKLYDQSTATLCLRGPDSLLALVVLDAKIIGAVLGMLLQAPPLPLIKSATPVEQGMLAYIMADLLYELGPSCSWSLDLDCPIDLPQLNEYLIIENELLLGEVRGLVWLVVDEKVLLCPPPVSSTWSAQRLSRLKGLQLKLPIVVGHFTLPIGDLASLGVDDIIVIPHGPRNMAKHQARLVSGTGWFPVVVENTQVLIEAPYEAGAMNMDEAKSINQTTLAERLPVELVIELGRLHLTGAQVLNLAPGDVLTLDQPIAASIDIRAGNRLIARGELVDVDSETGIRLIEVYDE